MKYLFMLVAAYLLTSCTATKIMVPEEFAAQATRMPVKGITGWQVNQKLSFGNYATSTIKRGWNFTASVQYTKFRLRPEEAVLKVLAFDVDKKNSYQKNRFQYTLNDGDRMVEIFATEKFSEKQLVYKSNNPWIGNVSRTNRYEYAFTAAIVPVSGNREAPWSLVLINKYDNRKDTAVKIVDRPYMEEEGYATDGKETIAIRPLQSDYVMDKNGKKIKVAGCIILSGYELQEDGKSIGVIDILENNIWLYNNLPPAKKLIVSSVASAILLKRMQEGADFKESYSFLNW